MSVYFEDWSVSYGSPYLIEPDSDDGAETAELIEDGKSLHFHDGRDHGEPLPPLAFVDGVRRGEASLYKHDPTTGDIIHGVAGAHACGAVVRNRGDRLEFAETTVSRHVIWGAGETGQLPPSEQGFSWKSDSTPKRSPKDLLAKLQERMRDAEAILAMSLGEQGYLTVIDGPLPYRVVDVPVLGYVKTHHKAQLPEQHHRRVPELSRGQRTSLFSKKPQRSYSAYLRLAPRGPFSGPWAGIVRIEISVNIGLARAVREADRAAHFLPRFAGIAHKDPRAPQNLQPIGALESHLRHLLGDTRLAERAVREAVARRTPERGPAQMEMPFS